MWVLHSPVCVKFSGICHDIDKLFSPAALGCIHLKLSPKTRWQVSAVHQTLCSGCDEVASQGTFSIEMVPQDVTVPPVGALKISKCLSRCTSAHVKKCLYSFFKLFFSLCLRRLTFSCSSLHNCFSAPSPGSALPKDAKEILSQGLLHIWLWWFPQEPFSSGMF